MAAFVPTTGLAAFAGRAVSSTSSATDGLQRPPSAPARTRMVAYPYTGSGYGAVGVGYGGNKLGVGFAASATEDIVGTAASVPIFSTFVSLLQDSGLDYELSKGGPFTVFAPTNDAFASLLNPHGFATLGSLLRPENRDALRNVLAYHVVKGNVSGASIIADGKVMHETLAGEPIALCGYFKKVTAGSAPVVKADIPCTNGVIHVVSSVLIPSAFSPAPIRPEVTEEAATAVLDIYRY